MRDRRFLPAESLRQPIRDRRMGEAGGAHPVPVEALLALDRGAVAMRAASEKLVVLLARVARAFVARKGWGMFGFARLEDHARERFARSARWVRDLAVLGEALEAMPALGAALTGEDGKEPIGRVAALVIARTASPDSVAGWIALARTITVRELRGRVRRAGETGAGGAGATPGQRAAEGYDLPDREAGAALDDRTSGRCRASADDDEVERVLVSFPVPAAVKVAFDEVLELHRAISGREETVSSFVEALVAEAFAGPHPPDAVELALKTGESLSLAELRMARATDNWRTLGRSADAGEGLSRVGATLADLEELSGTAGRGAPADLDAQMRALLELEDRIDRDLGRLLAEMAERGAWGRLLFAGAGHYAEERLRLARSAAEERVKLARALRRLPTLRRAYEEGAVGFEAALLVLRVLGREAAGEEVERAWVMRAAEATVRRLRDEARALGLGRVLQEAGGRGPQRGGTASISRRGKREASGGAPWPQDDADWHASLRRSPGDFRERVILLGRLAAASPLAGRFMRLRLPEETAAGLLSAIESTSRALAAKVEEVPSHEPWPDPDAPGSVLAARTFSIRCRRVPSWVGLLGMIEDFTRTWDDSGTSPKRGADAVYIRDGWRCAAPGCTSRRNLEEHHVVYRSRAGGNELSNRTCVCRFHHQEGEHGGLASCRGRAPLGIVWSLGADGIGGRYRNDRRVGHSRREAPPARQIQSRVQVPER